MGTFASLACVCVCVFVVCTKMVAQIDMIIYSLCHGSYNHAQHFVVSKCGRNEPKQGSKCAPEYISVT